MFQNDWLECDKKSQIIEEKQREIQTLQQNIYDIRTRIVDSDELMRMYLSMRKENETLKKDISSIKQSKLVTSDDQNFLKYNFELLQNKYETLKKSYEMEKYKNNQYSASCEDFIGSKELRVELIKLRKQISEKDKEISELRSAKITLEKQNKLDFQFKKSPDFPEKDQFLRKCNDEEMVKFQEDKVVVDNLPINQAITSKTKESTKPDFSFKELIEENEFLKSKYQKYNSKYVKFKAKYSETKSFLEILLNKQTITPVFNQALERSKTCNFVSVERQEGFDLLKNKRNPPDQVDPIEVKEPSKKNGKEKKKKENEKEKDKEKENEKENEKEKRKTRERKKPSEKQEGDLDNSEEKEVKKRGRKSKKADLEKKLEKYVKTRRERMQTRARKDSSEDIFGDSSQHESESEKEEEIQRNEQAVMKEHKLPVRRTRTKNQSENFELTNAQKQENFLNLIQKTEFIVEEFDEFIDGFCGKRSEFESVTQFIDLILSNYKSEIMDKVLLLFAILINKHKNSSFNMFLCLKEYGISNSAKLAENSEKGREINLNSLIIAEIGNRLILSQEINLLVLTSLMREHNSKLNLIGYFLIFSAISKNENLIDIFKFLKELLFESKYDFFELVYIASMVLRSLIYKVDVNHTFKPNSINKIFILPQLSSDFISMNIINLLNKYVDVLADKRKNKPSEFHFPLNDNELEKLIYDLVLDDLSQLNKYVLNEDKDDKLNFGENSTLLELYQLVEISSKTMSLDWLMGTLIPLMFNEFISGVKGSLKRIAIIYLVGVLTQFLLLINNNNYLLVKSPIDWIYSMLDPQYNEELVTIYDKSAALSFLIELVKFDPSILVFVRNCVMALIKDYDKELIPMDLREKLVRNKVFDKYEFK